MLLFLILKVLFMWILPAESAYYDKFVSKNERLLNDGNTIPIPAFGTATYTVNELDDIPQAVFWAIESGFRHIDTAALYINEDLIGQAIKNATNCGIVTREQLFITTKLSLAVGRRKQVVPELKLALKRLQLDYVDLFLIHWPTNPLRLKKFDLLDIWLGMEDAKKLGLTKSIGVSNFKIEDLNQILPYCTTTPAVNEIEVNPTFTNEELVEYCQMQGIIVMAYSPFGFTVPRPGVTNRPPPSLDHPVFVKLAKKYGVTTSQVVLRYLIDRGTLPIPKSTNKKHIQLNIDILNFYLTKAEVERINEFNINKPVHDLSSDNIAEMYKSRTVYANKRNRKLYPL